jgi:hypothetical protein
MTGPQIAKAVAQSIAANVNMLVGLTAVSQITTSINRLCGRVD